jgi:2-succinyl-6-hydroxy-2,4-cyclohexadiene-1-carboxylate synthase
MSAACSLEFDAAGVRLHAELEGEGPPLLLLHGFTGSTRSMESLAAGLRDRHRVIRLDLIGHGRSEAPRELAPYAMERCVDQVAAALDVLGVERVHVLGYSMGGRVALALAALRAEKLHSAILIGARAGIEEPSEREKRRRADEALAARIEEEGVEAFVDRWMALPLFASQRRLGTPVLAAARAQRLANRAHGLARSLRGMGAGAQPCLHDRLEDVRIPVLLAVGAEDLKFGVIARNLSARLANSELALIPEAGHAAHIENPDAFLKAARGFLARVACGEDAPT